MPFFTHEPKVDSDWQYEQVRSEINRLREVLRNPNLNAEERAIAQSQLDNYLTGLNEPNGCAAKYTKA